MLAQSVGSSQTRRLSQGAIWRLQHARPRLTGGPGEGGEALEGARRFDPAAWPAKGTAGAFSDAQTNGLRLPTQSFHLSSEFRGDLVINAQDERKLKLNGRLRCGPADETWHTVSFDNDVIDELPKLFDRTIGKRASEIDGALEPIGDNGSAEPCGPIEEPFVDVDYAFRQLFDPYWVAWLPRCAECEFLRARHANIATTYGYVHKIEDAERKTQAWMALSVEN